MRMLRVSAVGVALLVGMGNAVEYGVTAQVTSANSTIVMMDNCRPGDPGWNPTGGCSQRPNLGDVSAGEFGQLLFSPLISSLVGHPSWRNEPSHLSVRQGRRITVTNRGGRAHTLTRVQHFGGGSVPDFNVAMTRAPECPPAPPFVTDAVPPGASTTLENLDPGLHKFQCCFHPWMRATIRIEQ